MLPAKCYTIHVMNYIIHTLHKGHRQDSMLNVATAQKTNGKAATEEKAVLKIVKTESTNSSRTAENAILSLEKRILKVQELNIVIDKW